jgi:hypothetical protein
MMIIGYFLVRELREVTASVNEKRGIDQLCFNKIDNLTSLKRTLCPIHSTGHHPDLRKIYKKRSQQSPDHFNSGMFGR